MNTSNGTMVASKTITATPETPATYPPAVQVQAVTKAFGRSRNGWLARLAPGRIQGGAGDSSVTVAVDNVSFDIERGEVFGVLGPNGSGKSTLIRLMATLLIPDEGSITVFGHDVVEEALAVQRVLNRVSVEASFFKKLSPMENLLYGARLYGLEGQEARAKARAILERLAIPHKNNNQPMDQMSRGMQQKVAVARALLSRPKLLLLDEPTTGLDPRSKQEVQTFVREVQEKQGTTILLTTHDMTEAEKLCQRIAIMDNGRVVALDTPQGLKDLVPGQNGGTPTLEDVFLELTGKKLIRETDAPI